MKVLIGAVTLAACMTFAMAEVGTTQMMAQAMDLMARATGTSEVLALNVINLFILGGIAVAIIAGGFLLGDDTARSADGYSPSPINESSVTGGMCFLMYTSGVEEKLSCIQRSACEDPKTASSYLTAAKYWWKMHKLMKVVPFTDVYRNVMDGLEEATNHSLTGGDCSVYKW